MSSKKRVWIRLVCGFCTVALLVGSQSFITFADKTDEIEESIKEKQEEINAANEKKKELQSSLTEVKKIKENLESERSDLQEIGRAHV